MAGVLYRRGRDQTQRMEEIGILEREKIIRRENNMNKRMRGEEKRMAGLSAEKMGLISILLEKGRPFSRENESVFSTIKARQHRRGDEKRMGGFTPEKMSLFSVLLEKVRTAEEMRGEKNRILKKKPR